MSKYPTKKEVLADLYNPEPFSEEEFQMSILGVVVRQGLWKKLSESQQMRFLNSISEAICDSHDRRAAEVVPSFFDTYDRTDDVIGLTKPSIITFLHELGHAIFGDSELDAQRYAVGMYKIINPKLTGLIWKGHMLVSSRRRSKSARSAASSSRPRKTAASRSRSKTGRKAGR